MPTVGKAIRAAEITTDSLSNLANACSVVESRRVSSGAGFASTLSRNFVSASEINFTKKNIISTINVSCRILSRFEAENKSIPR